MITRMNRDFMDVLSEFIAGGYVELVTEVIV
jgi:hypothetical protein